MKISVFGLGNVLMGDDGLGPYVIRQLESSYEFPANVEVADLGTPGLDLVPFLMDTDAVVFVDTVRATGAPGDVRTYHTDQIMRHAPNPRVTPHDPGVRAALLSLRFAGLGPSDVALVGVIPSRVSAAPGLSEAVHAAVPAVVARVVAELARLGVAPTPRGGGVTALPWWEAPVSVA